MRRRGCETLRVVDMDMGCGRALIRELGPGGGWTVREGY